MSHLNEKEYWIIIPFCTKETAESVSKRIELSTFIIEKPAGTHRTEENFRVRTKFEEEIAEEAKKYVSTGK